MDKQTLSQYGWVVICVLVLAVMIAMATPFGNAISGSVRDTVTTMNGSAESKLDTAFVDAGYGSSDSEDEETLAAGLYDADDNLIMSWDEIVSSYPGAFSTENEIVYDTDFMKARDTFNGHLVIDSSITSIGGAAFSNFDSLTKVTFPNSVTYIGGEAFMDCDSLQSIILPDSELSIDVVAFESCDSLTDITMPNNTITVTEWGAFDYCPNLENIHFNGTKEQWYELYDTNFNDATFKECGTFTVHCTDGDLAMPMPGLYDLDGNLTISWDELISSGKLCILDDGLHGGSSYLESCLVISDEVTAIREEAFCDSCLVKVIIPNSVTSIGRNAFGANLSLSYIEIPNTVTSIGDYAFYEAFRNSSTSPVIEFKGTLVEWWSIEQGTNVFKNCPTITVNCTDGTDIING